MPVYAECGAFMYLGEYIDDDSHPLEGLIPSSASRTKRLQRFGYATLKAKVDNILCKAGEEIRCHEFHYYDSTQNGDSFVASKPDARSWDCIYTYKKLLAGYPHIHFYSNPSFASNFLNECYDYKNRRLRT
jgi:cobyrinic acid a,c-diamide synthase